MQRQLMMVEDVSSGEEGRYSVTIAATPDIGNGTPLDIESMDVDRYLRNPVVLWSHAAWDIPVGQTLSLEREDGRVRADFEFLPGDEFADRVKNAWDRGFLRAASIGWENDGVRDIMLEWSIVNIPADPEALRSTHLRMIEALITPPDTGEQAEEGVDTGHNGDPTSQEAESEEAEMPDTVTEQIPEETAGAANTDSAPDMQGRLNDALLGASLARKMDESTRGEDDADDDEAETVDAADLADVIARAVNSALDARAAAAAKAESEAADADEVFRAAVAHRSQIIEHAKPHLPEGYNAHEKSNTEIMREALGDKATDGMSEDFMRGLLMGMSAPDADADDAADEEGEDKQDKADNSEARERARKQRADVSEAIGKRTMEEMAFGPPSDHYKEYREQLSAAWKGGSD